VYRYTGVVQVYIQEKFKCTGLKMMNRGETRIQDSIVVLGLYRTAGWYRSTTLQG